MQTTINAYVYWLSECLVGVAKRDLFSQTNTVSTGNSHKQMMRKPMNIRSVISEKGRNCINIVKIVRKSFAIFMMLKSVYRMRLHPNSEKRTQWQIIKRRKS